MFHPARRAQACPAQATRLRWAGGIHGEENEAVSFQVGYFAGSKKRSQSELGGVLIWSAVAESRFIGTATPLCMNRYLNASRHPKRHRRCARPAHSKVDGQKVVSSRPRHALTLH